jgi:hypothetical protein
VSAVNRRLILRPVSDAYTAREFDIFISHDVPFPFNAQTHIYLLCVYANCIAPYGCAPYSANKTASDTVNYKTCSFNLCPGNLMVFTMCNRGGTYKGDPYLMLYAPNGTMVAQNDDFCNLGSQISFSVPSSQTTCQPYTLHEGKSLLSGYQHTRAHVCVGSITLDCFHLFARKDVTASIIARAQSKVCTKALCTCTGPCPCIRAFSCAQVNASLWTKKNIFFFGR